MGDEILQRQRRGLEVGRRPDVRQRQVEVVAGPQDVDQDHAEQQRDQRAGDEPGHRLGADPADRLGVAHVGHTDTRVENTSGAMIILISRRKMSVIRPI